MQQDRGILQKLCSTEQSSTPNPRHQFILDLQAWLENLVKEGHLLILFMDSNEDLDIYKGNFCPLPYNPGAVTRCEQHDGSMSTLLKTCGLIDVLQTRNSDKAPATYNRGKKWLNYIFVSSIISSSVLWSGILPFYYLFLSDHRPCYIDIDANALFNKDTSSIVQVNRKGLQLTDPRKVEKYREGMREQVEYHNIMDKIRDMQEKADQSLWTPPEDTEVWESWSHKLRNNATHGEMPNQKNI